LERINSEKENESKKYIQGLKEIGWEVGR